MKIPAYLKMPDQDIYFEELTQVLADGVSDNGFVIPSVTNNQLTVDNVVAPDGTVTTLANLMPNGTIWFVTDHVPPVYVGKIAGALVQFTSAPYP